MSRRVSDIFAEHVEDALDKHGNGEEIRWDSQYALNDQGGQSLVLIIWIPSATLGQHLIGSAAFHTPPPRITREEVDHTVRAFLEGLRGERTKSLSAAQNSAGGPVAAHSGLILP